MHLDAHKLGDELLNMALHKSAESFSNMTMVQAMVSDFITEEFKEIDLMRVNAENVLMLKTELVGHVKGINYFVFTPREIKTLCSNCFPDDFSEEDFKEMTVEYLKEIENVLAAATVSVLSEGLKVEMYGDVPKIQAVNSSLLSSVLHKETSELKPKLMVSCSLEVPQLSMSPKIYWFFGEEFMNELEEIKT